eukprot:CAMPEP_0179893268 /NCGR_PEP_ID=MMETSP0982-20121206/34687_1 /TAXON_ID=483367 /ORGANISM="non described non described, Strain CCMP 2436" /LENGTH=102 /DNA_ID=CAMNT_0021789831 /DNA_START=80 /DNA_END=388 /DNA_ORIENTATION=-
MHTRQCYIKAEAQIKRAAVLVRVPQHLEMPSISSSVAGAEIPWAVARAEPRQCAQLPLRSSSTARPRGEHALPVVDQLLEHAHAADEHGEGKLAYPRLNAGD